MLREKNLGKKENVGDGGQILESKEMEMSCLLYTSDAADEDSPV